MRIPNLDPYELIHGCVLDRSSDTESYIDLKPMSFAPPAPFLDIDPEMYLSEFFQYKELIYSDTAETKGIDNRVSTDRPDIIERAKYVAKTILDPLRRKYGPFRVNSWYRGPELEYAITSQDGFKKFVTRALVGTSKSKPVLALLSQTAKLAELQAAAAYDLTARDLLLCWNDYFSKKQHPNGEAVDLKIHAATSIQKLYEACKALNAPYDQIILEMHKPKILMSGWVHYSAIDESLAFNKSIGRKNRFMDFKIS